MQLNPNSIAALDLLIQTAVTAGLKKLVIESGKIRGIDDKQSVAIITANNVPDLGGKQARINHLEQLSARMNLVRSQGTLEVEATVASNDKDISILDMRGGKTKAQFRCASVEAVKGVPKSLNDTIVWELTVNSMILPTLTQGVAAMNAEIVTIASKNGKNVTLECVDTNKDVFVTDIDDPVKWIGTTPSVSSFCNQYPAKVLVSLLKEAAKDGAMIKLTMGSGGILSLLIHGFDFFIIPKT